MNTDFEPAADVLTGALLSRVVEPIAGEAVHGHESHCLNCGAQLAGRYCQHCGQPADTHRTLAAFGHDFLHSILHFDSKVWRTLPLLALHPGQLTRRYARGERVRFISPLALFLFAAFLMFAAFKWFGMPLRPQLAVVQHGRTIDAGHLGAEIANLRVALAAAQSRGASDGELQPLRNDLSDLQRAEQLMAQFDSPEAAAQAAEQRLPGFTPAARLIAALGDRELLFYKLESHAYKYSWALIPISVPFLWMLMAWRRQYNLYDHTVFVTYSLSFASLLLAIMAVVAKLGPSQRLGPMLMFAQPVHMFAQLRGAYALRWYAALWRTVVLIGAAFISLALFGAALVAMDVL